MARKRKQLLSMFPPGAISPEQASEALRNSKGDLEEAKRAILAARAKHAKPMTQTPTAESSTVSVSANFTESRPKDNEGKGDENISKITGPLDDRRPPRNVVVINNLTDRQYCCVWWIEVYNDGYRPDIARSLLARVARHVNPILRERGWRVKRLIESASPKFLGVCVPNGRGDADAASANIQLNLRQLPSRQCRQFRTFSQVLSVMLHEITHISIGLEDIHPPAFWELLDEIKQQYHEKLSAGEVAAETDDYGCNNTYITGEGKISTIEDSAASSLGNAESIAFGGQKEWCGAGKGPNRRRGNSGFRRSKRSSVQAMGVKAAEKEQKRRPLKKGTKMIDKRTKAGKAKVAALRSLTPRELAARAALERLQGSAWTSSAVCHRKPTVESKEKLEATKDQKPVDSFDSDSCSTSDENEEVEVIEEHPRTCGCRCCEWDKLLCRPAL